MFNVKCLINELLLKKVDVVTKKPFFFFPSEKQPKSLKSRFFSFFKNTVVKRRGNNKSDLQPPLDTDSPDPQPGPSHLESVTHQGHTDPQPGPSGIRQGICVPNPEGLVSFYVCLVLCQMTLFSVFVDS